MQYTGRITAVRGSVIDAVFPGGAPPIFSLLQAGHEGRTIIEAANSRDCADPLFRTGT
jgi:hypothetical protein